jgi:hypothetical protein
MTVYLGKYWQSANPFITATHATVNALTARLKNVGHKLCMENFFSSPELSGNYILWQ